MYSSCLFKQYFDLLFIHVPLYFHGKLFCALSVSGHCTQLTLSFFNQDGGLVEEPTTSPFLPSPSLKLPLSNSALPNQTLGGIASGLGMQNLNSSRQVRYLFNDNCVNVRTLAFTSQRTVQWGFLFELWVCVFNVSK